jgi:P27 family predicted phage terminase small subunit
LKVLEGNLGHRPINKLEPKPKAGEPDRPSFLDRDARDEWDRIMPELLRLGIITKIDGSALAAYCINYSRWKKAEEALAKKTKLTKTTKQGTWAVAEVKIAREAMQQMKLFAAEFGLTPASRSRIATSDTGAQGGQAKDKSRFFRSAGTGS